jgi:rhamnose transport system substrate-binding protein
MRKSIALIAMAILIVAMTFAEGSKEKGAAPAAGARKYTMAMIPKLKGIDYFNACEQGAREAAKELGVDLIYDGPIEGRVDQQIEMISNWISQRVDAILVSPNDPTAIAPILKKARAAGIKVLTWDADAAKDARDFLINQASAEAIGFKLMDNMAAQIGETGEFAIVTAGLTDANQNSWIDAIKVRQAAKYPKTKLLAIVPSETDQQLAFKRTQELIKTYPTMKGVFGLSSMAFPGCAEAIVAEGKAGKIVVEGLSTPSGMRSFVKDGVVKNVTLWNPIDLGYLTIYAAKATLDGTLKAGSTKVAGGKLGDKVVNGDEVMLGDPYVFTKANIDNFKF